MNLNNLVVVVTGASGNLGQAVVETCTQQGATVLALGSRSGGPVPGAAGVHPADLLDPGAVQAAVAAIAQAQGRIDALIHTVGGFAMGTPVHETPADDFETMLDMNVRSLLNTARAVVPLMQRQGRGRIVTVGAAAAHAGLPGLGAYLGSKSMLLRLTESMSEELKGHGINVNAVLPGVIDTPQNRAAMPDADPGDWVSPADLAAVIAFLCSDAARAVHGALVPVRGVA